MSSSFMKPSNPGYRPINLSNSFASPTHAETVAAAIDEFFGGRGQVTVSNAGSLSPREFKSLPKNLQDPQLWDTIHARESLYSSSTEYLHIRNSFMTDLSKGEKEILKGIKEFRADFTPHTAPKFYKLFKSDYNAFKRLVQLSDLQGQYLNTLNTSPYGILGGTSTLVYEHKARRDSLDYFIPRSELLNTLYSNISNYYWITHDMEYLILDGACDVPTMNFATDSISPNGFIFFEKTFQVKELLDNTQEVFTYGNTTYSKSDVNKAILAELNLVDYMSWSIHNGYLHITGGSFSDAVGLVSSNIFTLPMDMDLTPEILFKSVIASKDRLYTESSEHVTTFAYFGWLLTRILGSFFTMCTSPGITDVRGARGGGGGSSNNSYQIIETPGKVIKSDQVLIIDIRPLQHKKQPQGTAPRRKINKRFEVRGHWRMQPYANGVVKKIWIQGYIKGPEGAPLVLRDKVFRLI